MVNFLKPGSAKASLSSGVGYSNHLATLFGQVFLVLLLWSMPLQSGEIPFANGDFSAGMQGWSLAAGKASKVKSNVEADAYEGQAALRIEVEEGGTHAYDVSLSRPGLKLQAGRRYLFQFYCRMEAGAGKVYVSVGRSRPPYGQVAKGSTFEVKDSGWKQCQYTFECPITDDNMMITVGNLGVSGNVYYFASFSLMEE